MGCLPQQAAELSAGSLPNSVAISCSLQHCACMASITIRNVPEETRAELAGRAASSGRSLQEYLRAELVELAARPDVAAVVARARARTRSTGSVLSAEVIVGHRDADRR